MRLKGILIVGTTAVLWLGALAIGRNNRDLGERDQKPAKQQPPQTPAENIEVTKREAQAIKHRTQASWAVKGRVIQKLPDGLLVESVGGLWTPERTVSEAEREVERLRLEYRKLALTPTYNYAEQTRTREKQKILYEKLAIANQAAAASAKPAEKELPIYEGTCLLLDHPNERYVVDGDMVFVRARWADPDQFSYQTVLGATKTVRQFLYVPKPK